MPFDFSAVSAPFRMQPGLRRIAPGAQQLTPIRLGTRSGSRALSEKLAVLRTHSDQALLCEPGFDAAPALQALCAHAASEHGAAFSGSESVGWQASELGWALTPAGELHGNGRRDIGDCLAALQPQWRLAALVSLAFEQDFAILDADSSHIAWTAVCLPSRWAPEDKVGRPFAQVHAPVADNAMLIAASEALVRLVTGVERWERFVWTITTDSALDEHPKRTPRAAWPANASSNELAAAAYWRTEHQTFIPLAADSVAGRRQAVFTIHIESGPLIEAIDTAQRAQALHAALSTMSPAVLEYRGLGPARDRLLDWLAQRAI